MYQYASRLDQIRHQYTSRLDRIRYQYTSTKLGTLYQ